jgi:hypothetical protein
MGEGINDNRPLLDVPYSIQCSEFSGGYSLHILVYTAKAFRKRKAGADLKVSG